MDRTFGYFGKLPGHGDFIRLNSSESEIHQIDKWIQEGIYSLRLKQENWREGYRETAPFNFVVPFETKTIFGSLYFSNDKSGRDFPFVVHTSYNKSSLPEFQHFLPVIHKTECNFIGDNLYNRINEDPDFNPNQVITDIEQIKHKYNNFLKSSQADLWISLFGDFNDERKYQLTNMVMCSSEIENFQGKIPFGRTIPMEFITAFFIQLLLRVRNKKNTRLTLFWNESDIVFINSDGLKSISLTNLINESSENAADIFCEGQSTDNSFLYKQMLDDRDLSIKDLINNL